MGYWHTYKYHILQQRFYFYHNILTSFSSYIALFFFCCVACVHCVPIASKSLPKNLAQCTKFHQNTPLRGSTHTMPNQINLIWSVVCFGYIWLHAHVAAIFFICTELNLMQLLFQRIHSVLPFVLSVCIENCIGPHAQYTHCVEPLACLERFPSIFKRTEIKCGPSSLRDSIRTIFWWL